MTEIARRRAERNSEGAKSNDPLIVAEWPLNRGDRLRVSIEDFKGAQLISIRKWFTTEGGELRPTSKGISLAVRHLPQLAAAVESALILASDRGLVEMKRLDQAGLAGVSHETIGGRAAVSSAD